MLDKKTGSASEDSGQALKNFYRRRKVLVIGADGFLGLNCTYALRRLGADVTVFTRRVAPRADEYTGKVRHGDLKDIATVEAAVAGQSVVFDFAGTAGAVKSNLSPEKNLDDDCRTHLNLFQACAEADKSPLIVFCSSRLVYGKPRRLPVGERHQLAPQSMYAVHKITAENYLEVFRQTHDLRYCVLRLSNPYGPHQSHESTAYGVINHFIRAAARQEPIRIYGDGKQRRDYIYVEDAIHAFLHCAAERRCYGEKFNLGGRGSVSIGEAAQHISRLAGGTPIHYEPWPHDYKKVETGDYETDMSKLDERVQLPPATPFEEGLKRTLAFYGSRRAAQAPWTASAAS